MKVLIVSHHSMDPLNTPAIMNIEVYIGSEEDAKPIEANTATKRRIVMGFVNVREWIGWIAGMAIFGFGVTAAVTSLIEVVGYIP